MAWEFSHYKKKDGDIIIDEDDSQPGMSFNFYNCENIKVVIPKKIKSILLSRCKKVDLKFDETIAMVEVIRSDECKVRIMVGNKRVEAQHCQQLQFYLTEVTKAGFKVAATACQSVSINYPKVAGSFNPDDSDDDDQGQLIMPETWEAFIKPPAVDKHGKTCEKLDVRPADMEWD